MHPWVIINKDYGDAEMQNRYKKIGFIGATFLTTFISTSAYSANLTMLTTYLNSGGVAGNLSTVGDQVNGNVICPAINTNANGVPGCDMSADVGYLDNGTPSNGADDTYAGDLIIRTNDVFTVQAAFSWVGTPSVGEDNITLTGTLPAGAGFIFDSVPGFCLAGSSLSADKKTITCVRSGFDTNGTGSYAEDSPFPIRVEGDAANGAQPGDISFTITDTIGSASATNGVLEGNNANLLTVTAAPRWNVQKANYTTIFGVSDDLGNPGFEVRYFFQVEVDEVAGATDTAVGPLGNEALSGGSDATVTFQDDLSGISPNAKLITWDAKPNFIDAAFPTGLNPCEMDYFVNEVYPATPNPLGGVDPDRRVPVAPGVSTIGCVPVALGSQQIQVTMSHIDGTLTNAPTKNSAGASLPVTRKIAAAGTMRVFVPLSDVPANGPDGVANTADDNSLIINNCLTNFDPVGISGGANFGGGVDGGGNPIRESELDNCAATILFGKRGSGGKNYRIGWSDEVAEQPEWDNVAWSTKTTDATSVGTGDGVITRGGLFGTFQPYQNLGGSAIANPVLCDVIDTDTYEMVAINATDYPGTLLDDSLHAVDLNWGSTETVPGITVEYGTGYVGSWPPDPTVPPSGNGNEVVTECNDPGTWYPTLTAAIASNTGAVSKVRVSAPALPISLAMGMRIKQRARTTFLYTQNGHFAGDIIPENTLLVNYATYKSEITGNQFVGNTYTPLDYTQTHQSTAYGDRIIMINAKARVLKTMTPTVVQSGDTVNVSLTPSFTTDAPVSETANVTIKDLLPQGLSYVSGTVTGAYTPVGGVATNFAEPVVISPVTDALCNTHVADLIAQGRPCGTLNGGTGDESILIWDLGAQETGTNYGNLDFNVTVGVKAPNGAMQNYALIESPADSSTPAQREANAGISNSVPTSLFMIKSIQTPLNEVNAGPLSNWMQFSIGIRNGSTTTALPNLDVIDLMPFNNDGNAGSFDFSPAVGNAVPFARTPASNFQGTFEFDDVTFDTNGGECTGTPTFWFTNIDPAVTTIDISPVALSNAIVGGNSIGSTPWCGGGTTVAASLTTCGYTKSAVTAVRVRDMNMAIGGTCFVNLVYSTTGNNDGDIYSNTASAKADNVTNAVLSNTVSAQVYAGSIGNEIWHDLNNDGVFDAGEELVGVTVQITPPAGIDLGAGDATAITVQTDANGNYLFSNLPAGQYTIEVVESSLPAYLIGNNTVDPQSDNNSTSVVILAANEDNLAQDFAYYIDLATLGSIGDKVWHDINNNGVFDVGEGLNNIDVSLSAPGVDLGSGPGNSITIQTNATGDYLLPNLIAGTYTVAVTETTLPVTLQGNNTVDPDGGTPSQSTVLLASSANVLDQDFGYYAPAAIGDKVWHDINNNGTFDAGEGLNGVTVTLTGPGGPYNVITSVDGDYLFSNLVAGNYTVTVNQAGLPVALQGNNTVDPDGGIGSTSAVTIVAGVSNLAQDFGYYVPTSIGDKVWHDKNNNGTFDAGEGLNGVTVTLTGPGGPFTVNTSGDGDYLFSNLVAGTYTVTVDEANLPVVLQGNNTVDPDATLDSTSTVVLALGDVNTTQDFAYFIPSTIGDTIWHDIDNDGVFDAGEGLNGITVSLVAPGIDLGAGAGNPITTVTSGDGSYSFANLIAGAYTVTVDQTTLPALLLNKNTVDPDGGLDSTSVVTLDGLVDNLDQDFAYVALGSIGDTIWQDINYDGLLDGGDTLLDNVTVTLTPPAGIDLGNGDGVAITQVTAGGGQYLFNNLPPGDYVVTVDTASVALSGLTNTVDPDGGIDSTSAVTLAEGQDNLSQNYAYASVGSITGQVLEDTDNDGVGDDPIEGVVMNLLDVNGNPVIDLITGQPITALTDATGNYTFVNVVPSASYSTPGDYQIEQVQPAGFQSVSDIGGDPLDNKIFSVAVVAGAPVVAQNFVEKYAPTAVPTLSEWALILLMMMLGLVGIRQANLRGGVRF